MMTMDEIEFSAKGLLAQRGISSLENIFSIAGGANNKVFCLVADGRRYLLKKYFHHRKDPRNRLRTEFSFYQFAWVNGLRCLPQPLAIDEERHVALYEFISGRPLRVEEITEAYIQEALVFYVKLNQFKSTSMALDLPLASEAYFSVRAHWKAVEARLQDLKGIERDSDIQREAGDFVDNELMPSWDRVKRTMQEELDEFGCDEHSEISLSDRCLSPSDFGFHNAILSDDGQLRFVDFEYAGWDDPAKMVCDFFCQPKIPVSVDYYAMFVKQVASDLSAPLMYERRCALLLPVYQMKWCCIMLNNFLAIPGERRKFALEAVSLESQKQQQLEKSRKMLAVINRRLG